MPGALSAAVRLADATGARLAWVPRRAGERGALEAGALPSLLPGGRPVADAAARVDVAAAWGVDDAARRRPAATPRHPRRRARRPARRAGRRRRRPGRPARPDRSARRRSTPRGFLVSLEVRASEVTERADVVLPGRRRRREGRHVRRLGGPLAPVPRGPARHRRMSDLRVLDVLADAHGRPRSGCATLDACAPRSPSSARWDGRRAPRPPTSAAGRAAAAARGTAVLATWHLLLDDGRLQDGEPYLAGTAGTCRSPGCRAATAAEIGAVDGGR